MTKPILRMLETRQAEDGTTRVIISTPTEARDGNVWVGFDLRNYEANPVVPWAHDYSQPPVGRMVGIGVNAETGNLEGRVQWDSHETNPQGQLVAHQFEAGFLNAVSAGIRPGKVTARAELPTDHAHYSDRGYLMEQNELLEVSAVPVPADTGALAQRWLHADAELPAPDLLTLDDIRDAVNADPELAREVEGMMLARVQPDPEPAAPLSFLTGSDKLG